MATNEGAINESLDIIKQMWRHRAGHELPGTVLDTIDVLWQRDKPRPLLTKKKKVADGWHMIFTLPPGVAFSEVADRQEYFADATRAMVEIKRVGGYAHINISTAQLESFYPYIWDSSKYRKMELPIPIGYSPKLEVLDLAEAPHLLVAGVTGYGKSNLLVLLIHSLIDRAQIGIIDMKRLQFSYLKNHCALAKTEDEALKMMRAINREMDRRIDILEDAGVEKVQEYKGGDLPYLVLIIDEVAEIREKETIALIDRIVRLARATGISVVAATQRPSKKVPVFQDDTRDMFAARICYLMPDEISSRLVLGETCSRAAQLPEIKGRGIFKFGMTIKEIQSMYLPVKQAKKLLKGQEVNIWNVTEPRKGLSPR